MIDPMPDMSRFGNDGSRPMQDMRWIYFRAPSGVTVPAYGVVQAATAEIVGAQSILDVQQYGAASPSLPVYIVNGPTAVNANQIGRGVLAMEYPAWALYNYADGTPNPGDTWGPQAGDFNLHLGQPGFVVLKAGTNNRVLVLQQQSSPLQDFELSGDLVPGNYAYAYPMLPNMSGPNTSQPTFYVYDVPEGCRRAWGRTTMGYTGGNHGARGKVVYNSGAQQWQIVSMQTLSERLMVSIGNAAVAANAAFNSTSLYILDEGQDPSKGTGVLSGIKNGFTPIPANTTGIFVFWDQAFGVYITDYQAGTNVQWGIVQGTVTNQSGATQLAVSVKSCNADGSSPTGSAFNVWTPILSARDTALFTGDVVAYVATSGANPYTIVSDCFDDPMGTIRLLYTSASRVPNGWTEITGNAGVSGALPIVGTPAGTAVALVAPTFTPNPINVNPVTIGGSLNVTLAGYNVAACSTGPQLVTNVTLGTLSATATNPVPSINVGNPAEFKVRVIQRTS